MSDLTLDLDGFDEWFANDATTSLIAFVVKVGSAIDGAESQIVDVQNSGFEDSLEDRMIRDIRAAAFETIQAHVAALK